MCATVFEISHKVDHLGFADEQDFVLGPGLPVSPDVILNQENWSLYTLDLMKNLALFVELPDGFDLSACAFAFIDQHAQAKRVLRMSLDDMDAVASRCLSPRHLIFIFNIGRCGSTLVSQVFNTSARVWALSEPMVYPRLIQQNYDSKRRLEATREKLVRTIRSCTRLLFRPPEGSGRDVLAVKFHSQCLFQADLYLEAFPDASFVFLYRDALSWSRSWYQMERKYGLPAMLTGDEKLATWNTVTAADDVSHLRPYVDLAAAEVRMEDEVIIGWARNMEEYDRQLRAGVPYLALRYNELNRDREASLTRVFAHCGLPLADAVAGLAAFDRDSQAGTLVSRDVTGDTMTAAQVDRLRGVLGRHPRYGDPEFRVADIYST